MDILNVSELVLSCLTAAIDFGMFCENSFKCGCFYIYVHLFRPKGFDVMLSRGPNVLQNSLAGLRCVKVMPEKKQRFTKVQNTFKKTMKANLKTH